LIWNGPGHDPENADGQHAERRAPRGECRERPDPDDVALGMAHGASLGGAGGARELCVPLAPHESQMKGDQRQQDAWENQDVDDVQPWNDLGAREFATE